jgi:hypothetical protein
VIPTINNAASIKIFEDFINFKGFNNPYYNILRETAML